MKKEVYITVNYCYIHKYDLLRERERERVEKSGKIKGFMFDENEDFTSLFRVWNYFQTIMEQDYFQTNVEQDYFHTHTEQDCFQTNTEQDYFQTNTEQDYFQTNTQQDYFQTNVEQDYFHPNTEQDYFYDIIVVPIKNRRKPMVTSGKS